MNIMVVSPWTEFPARSGASLRTYKICEFLIESGNEVFLFNAKRYIVEETFKSPHLKIIDYRNPTRLHYFFDPNLFLKMIRTIKKEKIDLIFLTYPSQGLMVLAISKIFNIPYILDEHDLHFLRFEKIGWKMISRLFYYLEKFLIKRAMEVLAVSAREKELIEEHFKRIPLLVPNGVDIDRFNPDVDGRKLKERLGLKSNFCILFFGKLDYQPNREAVIRINEEIAPVVSEKYSNIKFLVVGQNPPSLKYHPSILITDSVAEIEKYIALSDLIIVPLSAGGGTRIKILEAMACGKVVISTPIGAEGLGLEAGKEIIIVELDEFSQTILRVIEKGPDPEMKEIARRRAIEYSWDKTLRPLNTLLLMPDPNLV